MAEWLSVLGIVAQCVAC